MIEASAVGSFALRLSHVESHKKLVLYKHGEQGGHSPRRHKNLIPIGGTLEHGYIELHNLAVCFVELFGASQERERRNGWGGGGGDGPVGVREGGDKYCACVVGGEEALGAPREVCYTCPLVFLSCFED